MKTKKKSPLVCHVQAENQEKLEQQLSFRPNLMAWELRRGGGGDDDGCEHSLRPKTSWDGLKRSDVEGQEKMLPRLQGKEFSFVLLFVLLGSYWGMPAGESKASLLSLLSEMLVFPSNTNLETLQVFLFELFCLR